MQNITSPWWYRRRGLTITGIYVLSFALGSTIWGALGHRYETLAVWFGNTYGVGAQSLVLGLAVLCAALCFAVRVWGSSYLTAGTVWNASALQDKLLVVGPFRYTRNPLYLGNVLMALGVSAYGPPPVIVFLVVGNLIFLRMLAQHEVGMLLRQYGDAFARYEKSVPWLLPRRTPVEAVGVVRPVLAQGLLAEVLSLAVLAGSIVFSFAPRGGFRIYFIVLGAGGLVQYLINRATRPKG